MSVFGVLLFTVLVENPYHFNIVKVFVGSCCSNVFCPLGGDCVLLFKLRVLHDKPYGVCCFKIF